MHPSGLTITLYGSGRPRPLDLNDLHTTEPADDELLWVDLTDASGDITKAVWEALSLDGSTVPDKSRTHPGLWKFKNYFVARVVAAIAKPNLEFDGAVLTIAAGSNFVVTHHHVPIDFLDELKERDEEALADIGCLGEANFVASLLDWHLSTYFAAVASYEIEIERLENGILSDSPPGRAALPQLRLLRKAASRLRRMLAPQRAVFDGLSRPDFLPESEDDVARHLHELDERYERAIDVVENARELVVGTFQLFSTQTELQTNERMKLLTFVTVVTGLLAVFAGALGMNFEADFFATKTAGFWAAVAIMVLFGAVSLYLGRRKNWL